ncbi:MAG: response regulator [Thioalkalivibrio sp.]|nr:response regulator [Thioalkalivibrio sp.]
MNRFARQSLAIGLLLVACLAPLADSPAASIALDKQNPVEITGPWEFYWDRFITPGESPDEPPTQLTALPGSWTQLSVDGARLPPAGHASYRLEIEIGADPPESLVVRIPMVYSAYRLYVDGQLSEQVGEPASSKERARPDYGDRRVRLKDPGETVELVLHVSNFSSRAAGVSKPIEIGTPSAVTGKWAVGLMTTSALAGGLLLFGLSQLVLFVIRRGEPAYLFFGLTVMFWSLQTVLSGQLLDPAGWHIPASIARPIDGLSALATGATYLWFISALFPRQLPFRYTRWAVAPIIIYLGVAVLDPGLTRSQVIGWLLYFIVGLLTLALLAILRAWRERQPDAGLVLLGSSAIALTAMIQIYWFNESGVRDTIASVGVLAALGLHSVALARRYARAFERSQRLETALRRANRMKDEFLTNTSHELRTPLHAMIGLAESLPRDHPRLQRGLDLIVQSGQRLARLIDDTISLTQLKQGELKFDPRPTPLSPLFHTVLATCQPLVGPRPVRFDLDIADDFPPVRADPDRLYQVLFNLVGNAIKFTDEGVIRVAARREDSQAVIVVEDTGIGIPEDQLDRMQRPYEQGQDSSLDGRGGFGLGLTISRALLKHHGTTLTLESSPGRGTLAHFRLPVSEETATTDIERVSTTNDTTTLPPTTPAWLAETQSPRSAGEPPLILIVDDDQVAATVLEEQLQHAGYRTMTAHSGNAALEQVATTRPELVLLDVMMPDMSGLTVCRRLREEFDANSLPIVLVTARTRPEDVVEGLNAGANDHLAKPFWRLEMLARVEAQLRIHENEQMRWALRESEGENRDAQAEDPRVALVDLLTCSVRLWELQTGTARADLAEQSRLWTVTIDDSARKTRTLDRYLNRDTLPKRPRWGVVTRTARFVADRLEDEDNRRELEEHLRAFERALGASQE